MQKSILITGCSSGIGYAAAHGLRDAGWRVFASCRKQEDCDRLIAEGFDSPRLDLADETCIQDALDLVLKETDGTLDALFNNGAFAILVRSKTCPAKPFAKSLKRTFSAPKT